MDDIQIDHPYVATEETKHWLKLDDLKDASPCDIVVMNNMEVLLHFLQKTLRAQEAIILKIDKKSTCNDAKPMTSKIESKWLKLTFTRSATPPQFVVMSNLWQLFQILQSLHQSQEKVLQTLNMGQKARAKKGHTDVSNDTDSDSNSDSDSSDTVSSQEAHQSSKALADVIANALEYAYEVYSKFLTKTGCHPYLTNIPSCQKASKTFHKYFTEHEGLIEESEIGPLMHKLDDDDARKLFITLSKKHNEAKKKGKRRIDEDMPTELVSDSRIVPNETSHIDANKKACVGQALRDNAIFEPRHPQSSPKASAQRLNNGIQYPPASRAKNSQPQVETDLPQLHNKGREHGGNPGPQRPREPLKEKRNLPEVAMTKKYQY